MFEVLLLLGFFAAGLSQLLPPATETDSKQSREASIRGADRPGQRNRAPRHAAEGKPKSRARACQVRSRTHTPAEARRPTLYRVGLSRIF